MGIELLPFLGFESENAVLTLPFLDFDSEKSMLSTTLCRKFAILLAGHASEYIRKSYGGVPSLFKNMLSVPGETWDVYRVVDGDFPSDDDLYKYEGFIITGSYADAHGSEQWVLRLCEVIQKAHRMKRKLLGICFGHQVLSRALGGKTGRAVHGWEVGLKKVTLTDAAHSKPYALALPPSLSILEIHQDEIYTLPPGGEVLASSETTSIEIFAVGDRVLGIQGHPEFTKDISLDILDGYARKLKVPEEAISRARLTLKEGKPDREIFKQLCTSFMKATPYQISCVNRDLIDISLDISLKSF